MKFIAKVFLFLLFFWPASITAAYFLNNGSLIGLFSLILIIITIEIALLATFLAENEDDELYLEYDF